MELSQNQKISIPIVILSGLFITFMASAIKGLYQVYFTDLLSVYQLTRAQLSLLGAIFGLCVGVFSPLTGGLCDRFGATKTILSGIVVATLAFGLLACFSSVYVLFFSLSILASYALTAMTFVPFGVFVDQLFKEDQKGMAYALLSNGTAIGFIVLSPLWIYLNGFLSWQFANGVVFLIFLLFVLPLGFYLYKQVPTQPQCAQKTEHKKSELFKHLKSLKFMLLALAFGGCGMAMAFIDVHFVALMKENTQFYWFSTNQMLSGVSLSILGTAEFIGAFLVAFVIRYCNLYFTLMMLYVIRTLCFLLLFFWHNDLIYLAFSICFGLTYMGTVIISSLLCFKWFGAEIKGKVFGCLFLVHQIFVFISVWLGGTTYDSKHHYLTYLILLTLISFVSAISSFYLHILNTQDQQDAVSY